MKLEQNYFALFEIEPIFPVDQEKVRSHYQALQKQYHPDRLALNYAQVDESEQLALMQYSALINDAYQTFRDSVALADYYLSLNAAQTTSETLAKSAFLMQQFELRETLENLKTFEALNAFSDDIQKQKKAVEVELWHALNHKEWTKAQQKKDELHYFKKLQEDIAHQSEILL